MAWDASWLQCGFAGFTRADSHNLIYWDHEDLAVTDVATACSFLYGGNGTLRKTVINDDFDLKFWRKVDLLLRSTVDFLVTLLSAEALNVTDRHADNAKGTQSLLHGVQRIRSNDTL